MQDHLKARSPYRRKGVLLAAAAGIAACVAYGGVAQAEMKGMVIGGGSVGADFFAFGSAMQQTLAAAFPDLTFENTATSGSVENVRLLHSREIDLAIFQRSDSTTGALDGTGRFEGEEPYNDIRIIGTLFSFNYSLIVPKDSDIKSVIDLKGKSIAIGPDPASQDTHAAPIFEALGIDYENDLDRYYGSYADLYRQLGEGRFDAGMGYTSGFVPIAAIQELASSTDIRWISFDADKLRAADIVPITIPAGTLPNQDEAVVVAQRGLNVFAGTDDLTDDQAYELAKQLHTKVEAIADLVPVMRANVTDTSLLALPVAPFEYHPGALKYWKEVGLAQ